MSDLHLLELDEGQRFLVVGDNYVVDVDRLALRAVLRVPLAPAQAAVDGAVRPVGSPDRGVSVAELASKVLQFGSPYAPVEGYGGTAQTNLATLTTAQTG